MERRYNIVDDDDIKIAKSPDASRKERLAPLNRARAVPVKGHL
jgi:hypothetical protein